MLRIRALRIYLRYSHATTRRAFKAHIRNSPAPPRITLYYNSSLFSVAFSALSISFRPILRQTELIVRLNIQQHLSFARTPPDKPVRLPSSHASSLRYAATFRLHALFASCSRAFRQVRGSFCRRTAVRRPVLPLSAPSIPASGAGERISLCSRFMWNIRLVIRQNLNVYRGFRSFMHIYTLRHCMFFRLCVCFFHPCDSFPVVAPRLTIAPRRCSAAFVSEPRIAARLAVFVGTRLHSVFPRQRLPLFDFSISFCLMLHGARKLFVCFSLLPAFRAFPSMIRSASSPVFN